MRSDLLSKEKETAIRELNVSEKEKQSMSGTIHAMRFYLGLGLGHEWDYPRDEVFIYLFY